jgi:hypothetical protein
MFIIKIERREKMINYVGEVLTWREYVTNLDLSHWRWTNCTPWQDRQVIELGDNLLAVPVYARDIYEDPEVAVVELPNHCLAVSWDNFHFDATVIKDEDVEEPVGWLLVERVSDREYRVVNGTVRSFDAIQKLAMQYLTEA